MPADVLDTTRLSTAPATIRPSLLTTRQGLAISRDIDLLATLHQSKRDGAFAAPASPTENVYKSMEAHIRPDTPTFKFSSVPGGGRAAASSSADGGDEVQTTGVEDQSQAGADNSGDAAAEADEQLQAAVLLLQRLLRGRAEQNALHEARQPYLELIRNLRMQDRSDTAAGDRQEDSQHISTQVDDEMLLQEQGAMVCNALTEMAERATTSRHGGRPNTGTFTSPRPPVMHLNSPSAAGSHAATPSAADAAAHESHQTSATSLSSASVIVARASQQPSPRSHDQSTMQESSTIASIQSVSNQTLTINAPAAEDHNTDEVDRTAFTVPAFIFANSVLSDAMRSAAASRLSGRVELSRGASRMSAMSGRAESRLSNVSGGAAENGDDEEDQQARPPSRQYTEAPHTAAVTVEAIPEETPRQLSSHEKGW